MAEYEAYKNPEVTDPVGDTPGGRDIGFDRAAQKNCSAILWDNLPDNADKAAVIGPSGTLSYGELCARAARWGNALKATGLQKGDRIALFMDDTPEYPAAFFGAVRAGFVPVLLNTLTTPDLLNFYLADTGAEIAICEAEFADRFSADVTKDTHLRKTVVVNGAALAGQTTAEDFLLDHCKTHQSNNVLLKINGP